MPSKKVSNTPAPLTTKSFKERVLQHLNYTLGTHTEGAGTEAWWRATCLSVNEVIFAKLQQTHQNHLEQDTRAVNYLSLEYLMGRLLSDNLHNLKLFEVVSKGLTELGVELSDILEEGPDLALGNGGLGRLAACYLDSLASQDFPAIGYGIHYEHGLFKQQFAAGRQVETPDEWREYGNPWEVCRPEGIQHIPLYGYVETEVLADGSEKKIWHEGFTIKGVPWDVPVVGYNALHSNIFCVCGKAAHPTTSIWPNSTPVPMQMLSVKKSKQRLFPKFSTPATTPKKAASCALSSSTSSAPVPSRTSSNAIDVPMATIGLSLPTKSWCS